MRLLDTTTLELRECMDHDIADYAILSHRWEKEEVTLQDLRGEKPRGPQMAGYSKIKGFCKQAAHEGWKYAWIDSCCIDKTSSAELSEAINSMFKWYENAQVCFVYLSDVPSRDREHHLEGSSFRRSKWFTRGWTLQELLAPKNVEFFNEAWAEIGTKSSLEDVIKSITGITTFDSFMTQCVAQKMSWAARRETTRVEDKAYCLMGLFNVNMPLLYGEGDKAFIRLQTEIMKATADETIFAWTASVDGTVHGSLTETGLLARSASAFQNSGDIRSAPWPPTPSPQRKPMYYQEYRPPWGLTNNFLHLPRWLFPAKDILEKEILFDGSLQSKDYLSHKDEYAVATFNCLDESKRHLRMAIIIRKKYPSHGFVLRYPDTYARVWMNQILWVNPLDIMETYNHSRREMWEAEIHVEQLEPIYHPSIRTSPFWFKTQSLTESHFSVLQRWASPGKSHWEADSLDDPRLIINGSGYGALMFANTKGLKNLVVLVGWGKNSWPGVNIFISQQNLSLEQIIQQVADNHYDELLRYDRISKPLQDEDGRSILISVRKGVEKGVKRYLVEIEIDQTGALLWKTPSWPLPKSLSLST